MFEKEAKERAIKLEESQIVGVYDDDEDLARDIAWNEGKVAGYEEGFKDGAEFGYNKANEWHDLKKDPSDLPKHTRSVWTNIGPSYYDIENHCWMDEFGRTQSVVAWCEPKFEE